MNTVSPHRNREEEFPLAGPALAAAEELHRRGLARGFNETVARAIDQSTTLSELVATLMDLNAGARVESDARAFQRYVLDETNRALERAGFEFSYLGGAR